MSIVNFWNRNHHGIVVCDTEAIVASDRGTSVGYCSKVIPLIHVNAVVAVRGESPFQLFFNLCNGGKTGDSIDTVIERVPGLFAGLRAEITAYIEHETRSGRAAALAPLKEPQEILLAGWSPSMGCVRCQRFTFTLADLCAGRCEVDDVAGCCGPWDASLGAVPNPKDLAEIIAIAHKQVQFIDERYPGMAAGGKLIAIEIDARGMRTRELCTLPPRDENRPAPGRPAAAAGRSFDNPAC